MEATHGMVGLGNVAAADASLAAIPRSRLLYPSPRARMVGAEFEFSGAITSVKVRPVYIQQPDQGALTPDGAGGFVPIDLDDMPRTQDDSQEVTFAATGAYYREFRARPGYWLTFYVQTFTVAGGVTMEIRAQYLPGSPR